MKDHILVVNIRLTEEGNWFDPPIDSMFYATDAILLPIGHERLKSEWLRLKEISRRQDAIHKYTSRLRTILAVLVLESPSVSHIITVNPDEVHTKQLRSDWKRVMIFSTARHTAPDNACTKRFPRPPPCYHQFPPKEVIDCLELEMEFPPEIRKGFEAVTPPEECKRTVKDRCTA